MKLGPVLIGLGLLFGYMFSGSIYQAFANTKPVELTFEEFYTNGTNTEWLIIHDAYVDNANEVRTEVTKNGQHVGYGESYMPLRANPTDTRPIKAFTSHRTGDPQKIDAPGDRKEINASSFDRKFVLETVRGVNLVGINLPGELPGILKSGRLPAAEHFLILNRDRVPPSIGEAIAMILFPAALFALGIFLMRRSQQKSATTPAAPAPKT